MSFSDLLSFFSTEPVFDPDEIDNWFKISYKECPNAFTIPISIIDTTGIRYEAYAFLYDNFKKEDFSIVTKQMGYFKDTECIAFRNEEDAAAFKLRWL